MVVVAGAIVAPVRSLQLSVYTVFVVMALVRFLPVIPVQLSVFLSDFTLHELASDDFQVIVTESPDLVSEGDAVIVFEVTPIGMVGTVQCGYVPVVPDGHMFLVQLGGVPVKSAGHTFALQVPEFNTGG